MNLKEVKDDIVFNLKDILSDRYSKKWGMDKKTVENKNEEYKKQEYKGYNKIRMLWQEVKNKSNSAKHIKRIMCLLGISFVSLLYFLSFSDNYYLILGSYMFIFGLISVYYDMTLKYKYLTDITEDYFTVKKHYNINLSEYENAVKKIGICLDLNKEFLPIKLDVYREIKSPYKKELFDLTGEVIDKKLFDKCINNFKEEDIKILLLKGKGNITYKDLIERVRDLSLLEDVNEGEKINLLISSMSNSSKFNNCNRKIEVI